MVYDNKDPHINIPTVFVIFGATGDLVRKKLIPAFFNLYEKRQLPARIKIVGFSRRDLTTETFHEYVDSFLKKKSQTKENSRAEFLKLFEFVRASFQHGPDYTNLVSALKKIDGEWGVCSNKLFYLAVAPELYEPIFKHLDSSGLTLPCGPEEGWTPLEINRIKLENTAGKEQEFITPLIRSGESLTGWTRIVVEKPFGLDLETAKKLDALVGKFFEEVQIYRIDHYLAKEMLQNILAFRFSNNLFEKNWDRESIERIDIRLWESIGVEDRGVFYDSVGALRDVGQNHLLQMAALVMMDSPADFSASAVRQKRAEILKTLHSPSRDEIKKLSVRAQYEGYQGIKGVKRGSETETYFKLRSFFDTPRWRGVPITLESGKRMGEAKKEIVVTFRHPSPCLCPDQRAHYRNKVFFTLEPEERIVIRFWSKKPGLSREMEERSFDFLLREREGKEQYVEEYEKLLMDCISGDQTLFISTDEIRSMWKYIDPIVREWKKGSIPLKVYKPDTHEVAMLPFGEEAVRASLKKRLGMVGLGKMGRNMALRLCERGWSIVGYDADPRTRDETSHLGISVVLSRGELLRALDVPRVIWLMVPAGKVVDKILFGAHGLLPSLRRGDIVIDGGNSHYVNTMRRAKMIRAAGVHFIDVGVSGGPQGARSGSCLMVGGEKAIFEWLRPLFEDLATGGGYDYVGRAGAGHFAKMVHNGIEYGMMQSIAEGFSIIKKSSFGFDLTRVAALYNKGSVIESRLLTWLIDAFKTFGGNLTKVSGAVGHTGEGEWTIRAARALGIKASVIEDAYRFRIQSKKHTSFTGKILTALRNQFGGHEVSTKRKAHDAK